MLQDGGRTQPLSFAAAPKTALSIGRLHWISFMAPTEVPIRRQQVFWARGRLQLQMVLAPSRMRVILRVLWQWWAKLLSQDTTLISAWVFDRMIAGGICWARHHRLYMILLSLAETSFVLKPQGLFVVAQWLLLNKWPSPKLDSKNQFLSSDFLNSQNWGYTQFSITGNKAKLG